MRKTEKVTYEIDPHNRLVFKSGRTSQSARYRACLDGRFKKDANNYLIYHVKKSSPVFSGKRLPQNIKLKGRWSLTKKHNLVYTLDKWQNRIYANRLILKTGAMDARGDNLLFTLTTKEGKKRRTYTLGLSGALRVDKENNLTFDVKKEPEKNDTLYLKGRWKVSKNNEIIYEYGKCGKIRKVTLKGSWDIAGKHKIFYRLEKSKSSPLEFHVAAGAFKKGKALTYRLGIGRSYLKRPKMKVITLSGTWKIRKATGLVFEARHGKGKIQSIAFGASVALNKNNTLEIRLKNKKKSPLGISFTLSGAFLKKEASSYLTLLKDGRELSLAAGCGFLF